ncbi:MAG TPA: hypothetical protein VGG14_16465 [Candidatus Sulfotelmatobacter sp.]|jgi:hypothetical protein
MKLIVLGTDHGLQGRDQRLESLIVELIEREAVTMIAEENRVYAVTLGRQVAESLSLPWVQIDMTLEDRVKAGIDGKLANRMQIRRYNDDGYPEMAIRYATREDGMREEFWLDRIEAAAKGGTVLVICGCLHCVPLSQKAEKRGHSIVAKLFHPEHLAEIEPELF